MRLLSPRPSPGPELFLQQQGAVKVMGTVLPPSVASNSHNSLSRLKIQFEGSLNLLAQVRGNQFIVVCGLYGVLKGRLQHHRQLRSRQGLAWIVLTMLKFAPQHYIFPPLQFSTSFSPWVHRFWKNTQLCWTQMHSFNVWHEILGLLDGAWSNTQMWQRDVAHGLLHHWFQGVTKSRRLAPHS